MDKTGAGKRRETTRALQKRARQACAAALDALDEIIDENDADEQLVVAVKALRSIASNHYADGRSRGLAVAALRKLRLGI